MTLQTRFGRYEDCYLVVDRYLMDGSLAIQIWNEKDGPVATLTKCMGRDDFKPESNTSCVDVNNLPEALDFIKQYGLGTETGDYAFNGYVMYPLVAFDIDAVNSHATIGGGH